MKLGKTPHPHPHQLQYMWQVLDHLIPPKDCREEPSCLRVQEPNMHRHVLEHLERNPKLRIDLTKRWWHFTIKNLHCATQLGFFRGREYCQEKSFSNDDDYKKNDKIKEQVHSSEQQEDDGGLIYVYYSVQCYSTTARSVELTDTILLRIL